MTRLIAVGFLAFCCLGVSAMAMDLEPGGVYFSGSLTDRGFYRMEVQTRQVAEGQPRILAVKVFAEPSHTLLLALVDDSSSPGLLQSISEESPLAMSSASIAQSRLFVEAPAPRPDDQRIRIEYATESSEGGNLPILADVLFESLGEVAFSVEPLGGGLDGGGFRCCGWCGSGGQMLLCGCVDCPTAEFTVCCNVNPCTIYCGHVMCSH